jgi:hypothetical protein
MKTLPLQPGKRPIYRDKGQADTDQDEHPHQSRLNQLKKALIANDCLYGPDPSDLRSAFMEHQPNVYEI